MLLHFTPRTRHANHATTQNQNPFFSKKILFTLLALCCCMAMFLTGCADKPKSKQLRKHLIPDAQSAQTSQAQQDSEVLEYDYEQNFKKSKKSAFRVALFIPKQLVGRYSVNISNTILAYLIARGIDYEFEMFDCIDENPRNLKTHYNRISDFHLVIAILSQQGVENLIDSVRISYPTYIPTINKERISKSTPRNLYFGGISYKEQLEMLLPLMQDARIVEYGDDSQIGSYLTSLFSSYHLNPLRQRTINNQDASNFTKILPQESAYFAGANLLLNTSASKSGLLLSQIRYSTRTPKRFLSTQVNFNPTILQLSTPQSRKNFFVVNAIGNSDTRLNEYATLLNSDLQYDWVSYATCIGVEFGLSLYERGFKRYFEEQIQSNQVQYKNKIFTTNDSAFIPAQ
ncbi:hypothetical protein [Helicobacter sp. T3_23-1059]